MNENEKKVISFDDLVSKTSAEVMKPMTEKAFEHQYSQAKDKLLSKEDDKTFITAPKPDGTPEVFKEVYFGQKHNSKDLEITGLEEQRENSNDYLDLKPITEIFQLARDMSTRTKRLDIKDNFYSKEGIRIKNDLLVSGSLFISSIVVFVILALLFLLFKSRVMVVASILSLVGTIFSGIFYNMKKRASVIFNSKKLKVLNEDINEIRIRLKSLKEDVSYFQAIRSVENIPNFEIEFSTRVNHIMDLINEYEDIPVLEFEKKEEYYSEIIKTFEKIRVYEKNTFDKYFYDKFKKT